MRWYWIDKFVEFESGSYARAVKNVTLAEEHLHDHFPGFPVMPGSLMVEGMAQTGGILLGEKFEFEHIVILAKVPKMTFHSWACPGDSLIYHAKLIDAKEEGGSVEVTATLETDWSPMVKLSSCISHRTILRWARSTRRTSCSQAI